MHKAKRQTFNLIALLHRLDFRHSKVDCFSHIDLVGSYGLGGDEFAAEELEDACADIEDTLEADNYEDQLPQPEVIS